MNPQPTTIQESSPTLFPDVMADNAMNALQQQSKRVWGMLFSLTAVAAVERIVFFFGMVYTRRVLGAEAIGMYAWTASVLGYFALVINPGLEVIAMREVAKNPSRAIHYSSALLTLRVILAGVAYLTVGIIALCSARGPDISVLLWIQGISLLLLPLDFQWLVSASEKMKAVAIVNVVLQIVQVPIYFLFIHHPHDLLRYALIPYPFKICLMLYIAWYCSKSKLIRWRDIRFTLAGTVPLLREAFPIALSAGAILLYYNTDSVFLGIYSGNRVVGLYNTAYRMMLVPTFVFAATFPAFFPSLARTNESALEAKRVSIAFFRLHAWMGFSVCAVTWAAGRYILAAMYGSDYAEEGRLYEWLSLNLPLIFLSVGLIYPLSAWGRQKLHLKITGTAAVVNVALNCILIPRYGATAAVITTLIAEGIVVIWGGFTRISNVHPIPCVRIVLPAALCSLATAAFVRIGVVVWPHGWLAFTALGILIMAVCVAIAEREMVLPIIEKVLGSLGRASLKNASDDGLEGASDSLIPTNAQSAQLSLLK